VILGQASRDRAGIRASSERHQPVRHDPQELAADGIRTLPGSLNEAIAEMERSELVALPRRPRLRVVHFATSEPSGPHTKHISASSSSTLPPLCSGRTRTRHHPRRQEVVEPLLAIRPVLRVTVALTGRLSVESLGPSEHVDSDEPKTVSGRSSARRVTHKEPSPLPVGPEPRGPLRPSSSSSTPAGSRLELREDHFDDFCLTTAPTVELVARLAHLFWRTGRGLHSELVEHGPLVLNLETYQQWWPGGPDLTYMEYELLRFLAARPGKVFTRETLLSRVWGYEYYGGARTVDVHVRDYAPSSAKNMPT